MNLENILTFARTSLQKSVQKGDVAIDATVGNGHDTKFLAELVGENGHVYGFDIQADAIKETETLLTAHGLMNRVTLFQTGHENALDIIPEEDYFKISGVIFNLGYLPRGDKSIVTLPETTIAAVEQFLDVITVGGIIVLVIYHGHPGGSLERDALLSYTASLRQDKFNVLQYNFINQKNNPPFIIAIERKK
ncbi:class I SAM-dependent methyltransferase [Lederbergia graminis]|uniref:Class I SAM-dependent methyltransferase n=1 Tax=Lederbergia graminis TaxID=735518 RepID=A0ABW0LFF9_9BACI